MGLDRELLEKRIAALTALQDLAKELMTELDLEQLLQKILQAAVRVLNASEGSLWFWVPSDELVVLVSQDPSLVGYRMSANKGIAGWVFTNLEPLIVGDVSQDERFSGDVDQNFGFKTHSLIAVPLMTPTEKLGVVQVVNKRSGEQFDGQDLDVLNALAAQAAIMISNARLYQELEQEKTRIINLQDQMNKKLARDLHDGPAQTLGAMMMNIEFILKLYELEPDRVPLELKELRAAASKTLDQVRDAMFELRPLVLETEGLQAALAHYAKRQNSTEGMNIRLNIRGLEERLPARMESLCFSIVREAVGNIKKHAHAKHTWIVLERRHRDLVMAIRDDGEGFDVPATEADYDRRGSLGLLNIKERAEALGARYAIESEPGMGTLVYVVVPLVEEAEEAEEEALSSAGSDGQRKRKTGPLNWNGNGSPSSQGTDRRKETGPLGLLGEDAEDDQED